MTGSDRDSNYDGQEMTRVSRRNVIGLTTGAAALGVGAVYGLSSLTGSARAQISVDVDDETVELSDDEEVTGITLTGTVEAAYTTGSATAAAAGMTVMFGDTGGVEGVGGSEYYPYDDVDPDADEISQDVSTSFSIPPEMADPDPGETIETEFFVDVMFQVDDGDELEIVEAIGSDSATMRIEREADDSEEENDDDNAENDTDNEPASATVAGSFTFEVEVD